MVNNENENRVVEVKNNLPAYPVQSFEFDKRQSLEIEYTGGIVIVTKEVHTEMKRKAEKYDEGMLELEDIRAKGKRVSNTNTKLKEELKVTEGNFNELAKAFEQLKAENEQLKTRLLLEQQALATVGAELQKFKQAPPQKKAYFSERELQWIAGVLQKNPKTTVTDIHAHIQLRGREVGNKRLANVSYETVRQAVVKVKGNRRQ